MSMAPAAISIVPPHSADMEMATLGSILQSPKVAMPEAMEVFGGRDEFYLPVHSIIFSELVRSFEAGERIDLLLFTQALRDRELLEKVGGASYLTALWTYVPTATLLSHYLDIVHDKFVLRCLIEVSTEIIRRSYDEQSDVKALLDFAQAQVTSIALDHLTDSPMKQVQPAVVEVMAEIEDAYKHRGRTTGLATGFANLDFLTMGFQPGEMIILAARPSMGKTALAMNFIEHIALDRYKGEELEYKGVPVGIFSIETGTKRLIRRSMASRAAVNLQDIRIGLLSQEKLDRLRAAGLEIGDAPIYVDDSPALNLAEFKARARRAVLALGVKLLMIDYLQLAKSLSKRAEWSKTLEISEISAGVKEIGRELNIPILALAQLNRENETRTDNRPKMSNLRESGQIEQDADMILLLHREEYYLEPNSDEWNEVAGQADLIIAKQKDGPVGTVALTFRKEFTRFEDRALPDGSALPMLSNNPEKRAYQKPQYRHHMDDQ